MSKELDELRQRKEELLLESEINRQIIALETSQLKLKAVEWRSGLSRVGSIYKWVAPLAGVGLGLLAARKQVATAKKREKAARRGHEHDGNGNGKAGLAALLAPLGMAAARQAFDMWRDHRRAAKYGSAE